MAPPAGFDGIGPVDTGGTLFPGLIELHNHLSYNALPLCARCPSCSNTAASGRTTPTIASSSAVR